MAQHRNGIPARVLVFFLLWLTTGGSAFAQNEWNIWHFGSLAGLDFNTGDPIILSDGSLSTVEGCASVSDKYGNLLFYTDGVKVWDKFHGIMPNGVGLFGHFSTTQCQIIPVPGDTTKYYIFTADFQGNIQGLCYSIVDMKRNNGLGDVMTKNKRLKTPVTEKICATRHKNGKDFWVVAHEWQTDRFLAYHVSSSGVSAPVISDQGSVHANGFQDKNAIGTMKISLDGRRLAVAIHDDNIVDILHFDNATGTVSYDKSLFFGGSASPYGLEFSPNGKWLYVSLFVSSKVLQLDLSKPTGSEMLNDAYLVGDDRSSSFGALQMGPDGRIYVACFEKPWLSVINYPDRIGTACDFDLNGISLGDRTSTAGLPPMIFSYMPRFRYRQTCLGDTTFFAVPENEHITAFHWDFGDPSSGALNTSTDSAAFHVYSQTGTYKVTLTCIISGHADTSVAFVNIRKTPSFDLGRDTVLCGTQKLVLNVYEPGAHYFWQNSSRKPEFTITEPGLYWVRVQNSCGEITDTIEVGYTSVPEVNFGKDSIFCDEIKYELKANWPGASIKWQDGSTDSLFHITHEGTYYVTLTTACGSASDTITVSKRRCNMKSVLEMPNVLTPDGDGKNDAFIPTYSNINSYQITIYNRWGQAVHASRDLNIGWDGTDHGKELKAGTYYYELQALGADGVSYHSAGTVTLIR